MAAELAWLLSLAAEPVVASAPADGVVEASVVIAFPKGVASRFSSLPPSILCGRRPRSRGHHSRSLRERRCHCRCRNQSVRLIGPWPWLSSRGAATPRLPVEAALAPLWSLLPPAAAVAVAFPGRQPRRLWPSPRSHGGRRGSCTGGGGLREATIPRAPHRSLRFSALRRPRSLRLERPSSACLPSIALSSPHPRHPSQKSGKGRKRRHP